MKVRASWLGDPLLHLVLIALVVAGFASWRRATALGPRDGAVLVVRAIELPDQARAAPAGGAIADVGPGPGSE